MVWQYPTLSPYITSGFTTARRHPVDGVVRAHTGTDFRAATGAPIYAVADGEVQRSAYDPPRRQGGTGAGNHIRLDHGAGITTRYYHLDRRLVSVGQRVRRGQVIGYAGSTGDSTAAHLHFEVRVYGAPVDPWPYLVARVPAAATGSGSSAPRPPATPTIPAPPAPIRPEEYVMASREEVRADLTSIIGQAFAAAARPSAAFRLPGTHAVFLDFGAFRRWATGTELDAYGVGFRDLEPTASFWSLPIVGRAPAETYRVAGTAAVWEFAGGRRRWLTAEEYAALGRPRITDLPADHPLWSIPTTGPLPA